MEFIRFGSKIPPKYWGCCACCIIQDFKQDPSAPSSIQLVEGDHNTVLTNLKGEGLFVGTTWEDIFWQRLRFGTFSRDDMPNHAFLAIMTSEQINSVNGGKWLTILKKAGFEFIRAFDNSVYTGSNLLGEGPDFDTVCEEDLDEDHNVSPHPNYLFGLFRNVGEGAIENQFKPPHQWVELESVVYEAWEAVEKTDDALELTKCIQEKQTELYNSLPEPNWLTEKKLDEQKIPVNYAGVAHTYPAESRESRNARKEKEDRKKETKKKPASPFFPEEKTKEAKDVDNTAEVA